MSNLGDLGQELSPPNTAALTLVGNLIGTVADFSGVAGAVLGIVNYFVATNDQVSMQLQQIQAAIQQGFATLELQQQASDVIARLNSLYPPTAQAQTAVDL